MKKNILKVVIGIILILIIIAVILIIIKNSKISYEIQEIANKNYFLLEKEEKYGVIDKLGNVIIEPIYDIVQIPNPEKAVFVCLYDYKTETNSYTVKVLNDKNEQIYEEYEEVNAIPIKSSETGIFYEKTILKCKKDGKYGLINLDGKELIKPKYDEIESLDYKEGTLLTKLENQYGVVNINGYELIKPKYSSITTDGYYSEETNSIKTGFIVSRTTEQGYRYGYIDYKGKEILDTEYNTLEKINDIDDEKNYYFIASRDGQAGVIKNKKIIVPHEYTEIGYNNVNNLFIVKKAEQYGVLNIDGNNVIPINYDEISFSGVYINAIKENQEFLFDEKGNLISDAKYVNITPTENKEYMITVDKNDYYGVADENKEQIIKNNYSYIEYLYDNYFIAVKGGKTGIINDEEKYVIEFNYDNISKIEDTNLLQAKNGNITQIIGKNMQVVASLENGIIDKVNNYVRLYSDKEIIYINMEGNIVNSKDVYQGNKLFAKNENGKWGFVDKDGNVKVEAKYDFVTEFENGVAGIKKDGKWGVIDENGNIKLEPIYEINKILPEFKGVYYKVEQSTTTSYYTDKVV